MNLDEALAIRAYYGSASDPTAAIGYRPSVSVEFQRKLQHAQEIADAIIRDAAVKAVDLI